jgi:glycosyltransferase involved in cell wall biosynthesis
VSKDPLVSIVTPSFNQAHFLEATIQSVLSQDYPRLEYIIVDGGSTDGSLEIIQKYADRLAWWISKPDQGQTDAINKGFAQARGDVLAWINSDDTYEPGALGEAANFLADHPEIGMVYGDARLIDENGAAIGMFPARQTNYSKLLKGYVHIPQQSSFFRGDLWRKLGPLDSSFYFAMDYDLWVRIAKVAPLQYQPRLWANFRLHRSGKTNISDDRCWPEMLRVYLREGGSRFSWMGLKATLRPYLFAWLPLDLRLWIRKVLP